MSDVTRIEGIGEAHGEKLKKVGVATVEALLERGSTREGRAQLAKDSGIGETLILRWVNHADLFRIKGVEAQYSELLEASGVDSVPELAQRNPSNLHTRMAEVNDQKHLVRQVPSEAQVGAWIAQAKTLTRIVTH
jgi:predicted flap endonuclease-1-like 5' DNA nuclease